jgi:hypothetical protein
VKTSFLILKQFYNVKKLFLSVAAMGCFLSAHAQWTTSGTNVYNTTLSNSVGIGTATPQAKIEVHNSSGAGGTAGNFKILSRLSTANHSTGGNVMMQNIWIRRDANGDSWATARFHDALSVDGSFLTPGVDTKTWWERDPWDDIQSWGSAGTTHLTIAQGNIGVGTVSPLSKLHIVGPEVRIQDPNRGRLQFFDNSGGNLGYSVRTAAGGGWAWQFVDGNNKVYFHVDYLKESVGIGTTNTGSFKLAVEGKIGAREVNVTATNPFPDYVFENTYKLRPLAEVEKYVQHNKHLPEIPSAAEAEKNGINLSEMNTLLLKKIEELTLYAIEQDKKMEALKQEVQALKK